MSALQQWWRRMTSKQTDPNRWIYYGLTYTACLATMFIAGNAAMAILGPSDEAPANAARRRPEREALTLNRQKGDVAGDAIRELR